MLLYEYTQLHSGSTSTCKQAIIVLVEITLNMVLIKSEQGMVHITLPIGLTERDNSMHEYVASGMWNKECAE